MSGSNAPMLLNGDTFSLHASNGLQANGTIQPSRGDGLSGLSQAYSYSGAASNTIYEGKQKARQAMAAATGSSAMSGTQDGTAYTPNGTLAQPNGTPQLSRKRSRDGTRLPLNKSRHGELVSPSEENTAHDEVLLDRYMQRDLLYGAAMNDQAERSRALISAKEREREYYLHEVWPQRRLNPGSIYGYGFMGYGNRLTDGKSQIVFSDSRGAPKGRRCQPIYIPRKDNAQQAEQHEELVPVRLDIELDKLRLRDTFTWNLHEKLISRDTFADYLVEDLKIPPESAPEILRQVKQEMREQIDNFYPHIIVEDGPLEPNRPYTEHKDDDMRIQIKLNITLGRVTLIDQFEWDINNPLNSPEEFARQMASENALSGEFMTAIAHSIREQSQLYTKSLYLTNHCFDGRIVEDSELRDAFLPSPVNSAFRPMQTQKDWMPLMYEMSEAEFERTETSMMREHRAQKRQLNRRGGPALPDLKDRQRTVRSLIVHSVVPGAVEGFDNTGIPKTRRGGRASRRNGPRADEGGDSDDLDSDDDSTPDSPAPSMLNSGTARTRGMRGAAFAAQAAMRANIARSATPDSQVLGTPHETRPAPRRSMLREESVVADEESLIVKLKLPKAKFRTWVEAYEKKKRASLFPLSGYASQPPQQASTAATPARTTSAAAGATIASHDTPATTPRVLPQTRSTPHPSNTQRSSSAPRQQQQQQTQKDVKYDSQGRATIDHWPQPDETPPAPPPWLTTAMATLHERHPKSSFEPVMLPRTVDAATNETVKHHLEPGALPPPGIKLLYLPRIRCNDCPGKLYTAQQGKVIEDFEVHLRNRVHRERVQGRRGESVGGASTTGSAAGK